MISEGSCDTEDCSNVLKIQLWTQEYIAFEIILQQKQVL